MRFVAGVAAVCVLGCLGVGAAFLTGALSFSDSSDAAPAPAPVAKAPVAAAPAPPPGAPKVSKQKAYGDWVYSCLTFADGKVQCAIAQTLSDSKTKRPVFLWRIAEDGNGGLIGIWQTPTGVVVKRGIVLDAGTPKPIAIPYEYCGTGGCEATGNLAADFLASLAKAQKASATIFGRDGKPITFPLSVNGLAEGLAALKH